MSCRRIEVMIGIDGLRGLEDFYYWHVTKQVHLLTPLFFYSPGHADSKNIYTSGNKWHLTKMKHHPNNNNNTNSYQSRYELAAWRRS